MDNKKAFGDFIQQKRKEANLTQKEFAEKLYITESAISKWERGMSYPDITLIKDICETLGISEHELLTASEDTQTRTNEKLANKYLKMGKGLKLAQILIYSVALLTCFICNLAVHHTLSWFFIVLTAEMTAASLTLLPTIISKNRGMATLGCFTVSLILLLLVCNIYTGGNWFVLASTAVLFGLCVVFLPIVLNSIWLPEFAAAHKGLICMLTDTALLFLLLWVSNLYSGGGWFLTEGVPLAFFWLMVPWGMFTIIRYTKMNSFFKTAACLGLGSLIFYLSNGVFLAVVDNKPMSFGYPFNFRVWNAATLDGNINMLFLFLLLVLTLAFSIAGIIVALHKNKSR